MANILTGNPFILDSKGIVCNRTMHITAVVFVPTAAGSELKLYSWNEAVAPTLQINAHSGAISGTNTLTITDHITAGAAGSIVNILASNGSANNIGRRQVESITSNDAIVIEEDNWTNEDPITYDLEVYTGKLVVYLKGGASDASPVILNPASGISVSNLYVYAIAGTAYVYFTEGAYSSNT